MHLYFLVLHALSVCLFVKSWTIYLIFFLMRYSCMHLMISWWLRNGYIRCPSTHEVKSSETVRKWEAYKWAEESKGQWRRSIADNVKKSEDDSTILYYQTFDTPKWIYGWVTENIKSWAHSFCCNFMKLTMCAEKNVRLILFTAHRRCSISWKLVF